MSPDTFQVQARKPRVTFDSGEMKSASPSKPEPILTTNRFGLVSAGPNYTVRAKLKRFNDAVRRYVTGPRAGPVCELSNELQVPITEEMMKVELNPWIAIGVIASTATTDAVYVLFNAAVMARRPARAASLSGLWYLLAAFAVISYTTDPIYALFAAIGSWIGAYFSVSWLKRKSPRGLKVIRDGFRLGTKASKLWESYFTAASQIEVGIADYSFLQTRRCDDNIAEVRPALAD